MASLPFYFVAQLTSPGTLINPFRTISLVNHTATSFVVGEKDHVHVAPDIQPAG